MVMMVVMVPVVAVVKQLLRRGRAVLGLLRRGVFLLMHVVAVVLVMVARGVGGVLKFRSVPD